MQPAKTDQGRAALAARDASLSPSDRRLLILADGKRSQDELTAMLGPDTPAAVTRLSELGFLRLPAAPVATRPAATTATTANAAPIRPRRSVAVAKIYMHDMLSLMRSPEADAMAAELHAASTEMAILHTLREALRFIAGISGPRYARKLAERLHEVVPEEGLTELDRLIARFEEDDEAASLPC